MKKLSVPMEISLHALAIHEMVPYPGGQKRLIMHALRVRGLITEDKVITDAGWEVANRLRKEIADGSWLTRISSDSPASPPN